MSELITTGRLDATEFEALTAEEVGVEPIEGDPQARLHTLCENAEVWAGLAVVEPSKFEYPVHHPGAVQVLEGAATVTVDGRTVELGPGDVVFLSTGTTSTWEITAPLREFFVVFTGAEDAH